MTDLRMNSCGIAAEMILVVNSFFWKACDSGGYCAFPSFLWESAGAAHDSSGDGGGRGGDGGGGGGGGRLWISKTEYLGASDTWEKRKEIVANETEMVIRLKIHASCSGRERTGSPVPCFRQDIVYHIICVSEQSDNKFRIQQTFNGKQSFSCIKFLRRSPSVIQVFQAAPNDVNEHRLCYDAALQRDEWPWIDPRNPDFHFCSLSGGFDFQGYIDQSRQKMCVDDWRSPRVESECLRGDGITFFFPSNDCNPFDNRTAGVNPFDGFHHNAVLRFNAEHRLYCWSEWTEENYLYFLLSDKQKIPRYTLRLANAALGQNGGQFLGFFFFSGVAPLSSHGSPPGKVMHIEMHMRRSEPGTCYDETDDCKRFAAEGKCYTNDATKQLVNFCLKSCGMCELATSVRPECHFAAELTGRWVQFDSDGETRFDVSHGEIRTTRLGGFVCKSKHWHLSYYKVLSLSTNGCRPRYSCIHMTESDHMLQYRLSQSSLKDESFSLCEFNDDFSSPTADRIRSSHMKTLFRMSNLRFNACGLRRTVAANVTFSDHVGCQATMSDVDPTTCSVRSSLTVSLSSCPHGRYIELSCVAHAHLSPSTVFLVTRRLDGNHTLCWVVKSLAAQDSRRHGVFSDVTDSHRPRDFWEGDFLFHRCRCSTMDEFQPMPAFKALVTVSTRQDIGGLCENTLRSSHVLSPFVSDRSGSVFDRNGSGQVDPMLSHRRINQDLQHRSGLSVAATTPCSNQYTAEYAVLLAGMTVLLADSGF